MFDKIRQRAKESHERAKEIMNVKQKGQAIGIGNQFISLALGAIILIISVVIFASITPLIFQIANESAIPAAANASINNIVNTTFSAFNLSTVALIVVAAAIIIGAAFLLVAGGRR
jgi:CHASE3 domain sensor protein